MKKVKLLLVEDNRINQLIILSALTNLGLEADVAINGNDAIAKLRESKHNTPYQLIIMDCQMPEMDGYQATRKIRQGDGGEYYSTIPIVAMTANTMASDKEACLAAGMNDYLMKPVDSVLLSEKLTYWLGGGGSRDSVIPEESLNLHVGNAQNVPHKSKSEPAGINSKVHLSRSLLPPFNLWLKDKFLSRINNNKQLAAKLIELFKEDTPILIESLRSSIENKDYAQVTAYAHKLKGIANNIGAESMAKIAQQLESESTEENYQVLCNHINEIEFQFELFNNTFSISSLFD